MKPILKILCALALAVGVANAAPEPGKQDTQTPAAKRAAEKSAAGQMDKGTFQPQTGSRIRRGIDLSGRITDGPCQLVIISGEMIKRSGYATVSGVLASQGTRR